MVCRCAGKTRTISSLNPDGTTIFTRDVEILVLNRNEFTYRIRPNSADPSVYYDIIHTRTSHAEPANGQLTLASTPGKQQVPKIRMETAWH